MCQKWDKAYQSDILAYMLDQPLEHSYEPEPPSLNIDSQQQHLFIIYHKAHQPEDHFLDARYCSPIQESTSTFSHLLFERDQDYYFQGLPIQNNSSLQMSNQNVEFQASNRSPKAYKNETKNIAKNYGKAILTFIRKNNKKVRTVLNLCEISYKDFTCMIKREKKTLNTIEKLRNLWTNETFGKCMRIISNLFLRRSSLKHIFNSRIVNYECHLKHRSSLSKALRNPYEFTCIKQS